MPFCNESDYSGSGVILPSSAIAYTGNQLTFVTDADKLPCNANLNKVISTFDKYVKVLVDGNDLTGLDKNCLDFDPATITPKGLHQVEIDKICIIDASLSALTTQFNDLNIGTEIITITLPECLQGMASSCAVGVNQYQLINLLILFANKLCDHETRISNLE